MHTVSLKKLVDAYISNASPESELVFGDMRKILFCFAYMKVHSCDYILFLILKRKSLKNTNIFAYITDILISRIKFWMQRSQNRCKLLMQAACPKLSQLNQPDITIMKKQQTMSVSLKFATCE